MDLSIYTSVEGFLSSSRLGLASVPVWSGEVEGGKKEASKARRVRAIGTGLVRNPPYLTHGVYSNRSEYSAERRGFVGRMETNERTNERIE